MTSAFYKPMRAYEYDVDVYPHKIVGRYKFIIGGEMADGTKCWYKCDDDGEIIGTAWYSMTRRDGKMLAILEAID